MDEDGFWNEDEQVLLFSSIKERMQEVANNLWLVKEYKMYRDMMEQIRLIEADILVYQETLRNRASKQELDEYEL